MGKQDIARRVKEARISAGLTQAEVANRLSITYQAISNYERGVSRIDSDTLKKLCEVLSISISDVLEDSVSDVPNSALSDTLTNLRHSKGVRQGELASALGVSVGSLVGWERNLSTPSLGYLVKISDYFNVSVDCLLGRNTDKNSPTVSGGGLSDEAIQVAHAYDDAEYKDKKAVRVILSIETDEYQPLPLVARGGRTITPGKSAPQSVIDAEVERIREASDKENSRF